MNLARPYTVRLRGQNMIDPKLEIQLVKLAKTNEYKVYVDRLLDGRCFYPDCPEQGTVYRQRTRYDNELDNYTCLCMAHRIDNDKEWDERWDEYYQGLL